MTHNAFYTSQEQLDRLQAQWRYNEQNRMYQEAQRNAVKPENPMGDYIDADFVDVSATGDVRLIEDKNEYSDK